MDDLDLSVRYIKTASRLLFAGGLFFGMGLYNLNKLRTHDDVKPSKIKSLAAGIVKIRGTIKGTDKNQFVPILSGKMGIGFLHKIEDFYWLGVLRGWRVISMLGDWNEFYVVDETGKILVDPLNAELYLKESYKFTVFPFRKVPDNVQKILDTHRINKNFRIIKVSEYVLSEGDVVEIYGSAKPIEDSRYGKNAKDDLLVISKRDGVDFSIKSTDYSIFNNKTLLLQILLGAILLSISLGFFAQGYFFVTSPLTLTIIIIGSLITILFSLAIYKGWIK